jgi:hypothetical protein
MSQQTSKQALRRVLLTFFASLLLTLGGLVPKAVYAAPIVAISLPPLSLGKAAGTVPGETAKAMIDHLTEMLPELESLLTPEQRQQFETDVLSGASFRKAFKALTLTPEQKTQLKTYFKELPKNDAFATLTPDQKKQLFMKKKQMFIPTPEEISAKISEKMKLAGKAGAPTAEEISAKISEKMKFAQQKGAKIPTAEEIGEKISAKLNQMKDAIEAAAP